MDHKKREKINLFVEISSKRYFLQSIFSSSSQLSIRTAFPLWSGSISILGINLTSFVLKFPILGFYHQHTQKLFVKMKTNFQPGMKLVCNLKHAGHYAHHNQRKSLNEKTKLKTQTVLMNTRCLLCLKQIFGKLFGGILNRI